LTTFLFFVQFSVPFGFEEHRESPSISRSTLGFLGGEFHAPTASLKDVFFLVFSSPLRSFSGHRTAAFFVKFRVRCGFFSSLKVLRVALHESSSFFFLPLEAWGNRLVFDEPVSSLSFFSTLVASFVFDLSSCPARIGRFSGTKIPCRVSVSTLSPVFVASLGPFGAGTFKHASVSEEIFSIFLLLAVASRPLPPLLLTTLRALSTFAREALQFV